MESGREQNKRLHDLPARGAPEEGRADGRGDEEEQEEAPYCVETRTAQLTDHRGAHVCHKRWEVGISKLNLST